MSQTDQKVKEILEHPLLRSAVLSKVDLESSDSAMQLATAKAFLTGAKILEQNGETDLASEAIRLANKMVNKAVDERIDAITDLT